MATLNRKLCEFPPFLWLGRNAIEVANTHRSLAMFTTECHFMGVAMVSDRMTEVASLIMEAFPALGGWEGRKNGIESYRVPFPIGQRLSRLPE